jgi:hypothetical protein
MTPLQVLMVLIFGDTTHVPVADIPLPDDPLLKSFALASSCAQGNCFGQKQGVRDVSIGMISMAAVLVSSDYFCAPMSLNIHLHLKSFALLNRDSKISGGMGKPSNKNHYEVFRTFEGYMVKALPMNRRDRKFSSRCMIL